MTRKYIIVADDSIKGFDEEIAKIEREWGAEEIEPCEDTISREAVLDEIDKYIKKAQSTGIKDDFISFEELVVKQLPSVTPKAKTGHWIRRDYWSEGVGMGESYGYYYQCSECEEIIQGGYVKCDSKYCTNCGAKMESEEEI